MSLTHQLDKPLSCVRPLPSGLVLEPNGAFVFSSCRRNRRTGQVLLGTGVPSIPPSEEEDSKTFQDLVNRWIPELQDHLPRFSSRLWNRRIAGLEIQVGRPIQVCLINGTGFDIDELVLSAADLVQIVSSVSWDRILESKSFTILTTTTEGSKAKQCHRLTWYPYHRLTFRMGRQCPTLECRRVVETICCQWIHGTRSQRHQSLGILGSIGKTTVLRQILRTLTHYYPNYKLGVVSETGELSDMEGTLDIPWQKNWLTVVFKSRIQILIVDCCSLSIAEMAKACSQLPKNIFVAGSGLFDADLVLKIHLEKPCYQLTRGPRIRSMARKQSGW